MLNRPLFDLLLNRRSAEGDFSRPIEPAEVHEQPGMSSDRRRIDKIAEWLLGERAKSPVPIPIRRRRPPQ